MSPPGTDAFRNYYLNSIMGSGAPQGSPLGILQSYAGGGTSSLQRGATGIDQFSNQMPPELRSLLGIATNNNTASGLDALKPVFQQNLTDASNRLTATAPGGRFSSGMLQAQGSLNQKSLNDFNLLAQNMIQQGMTNQINAGRAAGDLRQNALQLLLGPALNNAFSGSVISQPSALQQGLQAGMGMAQFGALRGALNGGQPSPQAGAGIDPGLLLMLLQQGTQSGIIQP